MYPSWEQVEKASTFLRSLCTSARSAANTAVVAPTHTITSRVIGAAANSGSARTTRKTPAATIVAAWSSALTGVGPSIASGSHTCRGNWADLPTTAKKSSALTAVAVPTEADAVQSKVPVATYSHNSPNKKPMSPSFVIQKAFTAALAAEGFSNQNPMRR